MLDEPALKIAQQRLQAVYDPQQFRAAAQQWGELLATHLEQVQQRDTRVLNWAEPAANIAAAERWLDGVSTETSARFAGIVRQMLDSGHNLHNPRYIGHQVPAPVPIAGLFDAVGSVTNQVMAIYEMGPWATAVERALVNRLGEQIGWQRDSFAGLVTHGGSLGNLTGLLTARNVALGGSWEEGVASGGAKPVIVVQGDAHYSVASGRSRWARHETSLASYARSTTENGSAKARRATDRNDRARTSRRRGLGLCLRDTNWGIRSTA